MNTVPEQGKLALYEDIYDAMREVVRALGGSKEVGKWLFPHLPVEDAKNKINDCLNRNRRDKLDPEQVMALLRKGREVGCHAAKHYQDDQTGYARSAPIDPMDRAAELQRTFIDSVERQGRILDELKRIAPGLALVKDRIA